MYKYYLVIGIIILLILGITLFYNPNKGMTNEWISEWATEASSCDTLECPSGYSIEGIWCVTRDTEIISDYQLKQEYKRPSDYDSLNLKPTCIRLKNG